MVEKVAKKVKMSFGGKNLPKNILLSQLENVSFHFEEIVAKWKFVFHIRLTREREFSIDAQKCSEIMDFLSDTQLLKTMMNIRPYYLKFVKEFVVDLTSDFNYVESYEYMKVHIRGHCFSYSPYCNQWLSWSSKTEHWWQSSFIKDHYSRDYWKCAWSLTFKRPFGSLKYECEVCHIVQDWSD